MPLTPPLPGENVLAHFHPSRFAFLKLYLAAIALVILLVVLWFVQLPAMIQAYKTYMLLLLVVAAIIIIVAEIKRQLNSYTITKTTIKEHTGILNISESSMNFDKISSSTVKQSLLDRIVHVGSIDLWSTGGAETPEITIDKIADVQRIKQMIDEIIQRR